MIEKLNAAPTEARTRTHRRSAAVALALSGAMAAGALLVRTRRPRASPLRMLDLAVVAAGVIGVLVAVARVFEREPRPPAEAPDPERFSHPAINVQRISFA